MNRLADQVIIVTGGSGLLGKSILELIKHEGGFCINADLNHETSNDLSQVYCDITDETSVKNCISLVLGRFGKINGLVNNAYPGQLIGGKSLKI